MFLKAKLLKNSRGATLVEYALIAALISIVAIAAMSNIGNNVSSTFELVANKLNNTKGGGTQQGNTNTKPPWP